MGGGVGDSRTGVQGSKDLAGWEKRWGMGWWWWWHPDPISQITDRKPWIWDLGSGIYTDPRNNGDPRSQVPGTRSYILDPRSQIPDPR